MTSFKLLCLIEIRDETMYTHIYIYLHLVLYNQFYITLVFKTTIKLHLLIMTYTNPQYNGIMVD